MAGTPTILVEGHNTTDAASYAQAGVAASTSGAAILIGILSGRTDGTAAAPTSVTGNFGTATKIIDQSSASGNLRLTVWKATGNGTSTDLTISFGGATQHNVHYKIIQVTSASVTSNLISGQGVSTASLTLPTSPASSSVVVDFFAVNSSTQVPTVGSGFTQVGTATTDSSPSNLFAAEYRTGSTSQTAAWTPAGTSQNVSGAVELTDVAGGVPVPSKTVKVTRTIANDGTATQTAEVDYTASSNTTSIAVATVTGAPGFTTGSMTVVGKVITFTDDATRTDSVIIGVTLTGGSGTTSDTVSVPPLQTPTGIRTRVWVSGPDRWA